MSEINRYFFSIGIFCKKIFFFAVFIFNNNGVRGLNNCLGRTIIFFKRYYRGARIMFFKIQYVSHIRSSPAIHILVSVSKRRSSKSYAFSSFKIFSYLRQTTATILGKYELSAFSSYISRDVASPFCFEIIFNITLGSYCFGSKVDFLIASFIARNESFLSKI